MAAPLRITVLDGDETGQELLEHAIRVLDAELLGVDLDAMREAAAHVEPYLRVDGTKVWSLMQLEQRLRPDAYGRVRGGYLARRRPRTTGAQSQ